MKRTFFALTLAWFLILALLPRTSFCFQDETPEGGPVDGEPAYTEDEIMILNEAKPVFDELRQLKSLRDQLADDVDASAGVTKVDLAISKLTLHFDRATSNGRTKVAARLQARIDEVNNYKTKIYDLDNPESLRSQAKAAQPRIDALQSELDEFKDAVILIAPQGRTKASYVLYLKK